MMNVWRVTVVAWLALGLSTGAETQSWRGQGRVAGKVTDEAGKPIEGVTVKLFLPSANGGTEVTTSKKGEWAVGGISRGAWQIDFVKQGYETRRLTVGIEELARIPTVETVMKVAADPNAEIREQVTRAAELMNAQKYAEARAIYEAVLAKYPAAHQVEPYIARTYYGEGQYDKAIEHLKIALAKSPDNVEIKLLLGNVLVEKGDADEGQKVLASIDDTQVKDPIIFLNMGIALLNKNKAKEAWPYFNKTVTRFPDYPDGYYYRGMAALQVGVAIRPDNQAEGDKQIQAARADLERFIAIAPNAPEAAVAKKLLEQLK